MANEDYVDISCIEEWLERKGWSTDLAEEEQRRLEGQFVAEYNEVRAAMWKRHYEYLDPAEKALIDEETHPSLSWNRAAEAEPYLNELRDKLVVVESVANGNGALPWRYHRIRRLSKEKS